MVYQQIKAAAGQLDIPVWSRNNASRHDMEVQAESCQKWPHPFRTRKLLGLLPEWDSGRDSQRLLVCGKNSEVGTRGRLVVGVQGGHLKMGVGNGPVQ